MLERLEFKLESGEGLELDSGLEFKDEKTIIISNTPRVIIVRSANISKSCRSVRDA